MNIAVIGVGILPTDSTNGIPAFHAALRELAKTNKVTVYSFIPVLKNEPAIRVRCVSSRSVPERLQYLILAWYFLLDHIKDRFEFIHAQSPFPAGVLARRLSKFFAIPWLLCFHAGEAAEMPDVPYGDLLNPFLKDINTRITRSAPAIMAMSKHQAEMVTASFGIDKPVIVLPRGLLVSPLMDKIFSSPCKFVHVSYYQPVKGIDMLLETFQNLSVNMPCELRIIGGNYGAGVEKKISDLDLDEIVFLEGRVTHEQTLSFISGADFLIHTSFCEGLPMVALEAMSLGTVVCGTAVGVMSDLSPDCCITVKDRNSVELARKILDLCNDRDEYLSVRRNAWLWAREHDLNWYVKSLLNHYTEIIKAW